VPAGGTVLNVNAFGGTGDADLYVRRRSAPAGGASDCASALMKGNDETCSFGDPQAGTYDVALKGFSDDGEIDLRVNSY
jgi:hypothetical protein